MESGVIDFQPYLKRVFDDPSQRQLREHSVKREIVQICFASKTMV